MLKYGEKYVDKGKEFYEQKYRQMQIRMLTKERPRSVYNSYNPREFGSGFLESGGAAMRLHTKEELCARAWVF